MSRDWKDLARNEEKKRTNCKQLEVNAIQSELSILVRVLNRNIARSIQSNCLSKSPTPHNNITNWMHTHTYRKVHRENNKAIGIGFLSSHFIGNNCNIENIHTRGTNSERKKKHNAQLIHTLAVISSNIPVQWSWHLIGRKFLSNGNGVVIRCYFFCFLLVHNIWVWWMW